MKLTHLPTEIISAILQHLLYDVGIREFVLLRVVCRSFEQQIPDLVYSLPTFGSNGHDTPLHLSWDLRMSRPMIAGLIFSKLRKARQSRCLTSQIQQTVELIQSIPRIGDATGYVDALVHLAAEHLPLPEVIHRLSEEAANEVHRQLPLNDALVAALYMDKTSDITVLLECGAQAYCRTHSFGEPLAVAACYSGVHNFHLIVQQVISMDCGFRKRLADVFCENTWALLDASHGFESRQTFCTSALRSALLARQSSVAGALTGLLTSYGSPPIYASQDTAWFEILRLAVVENLETLITQLLDLTAWVELPRGIETLLEDASRCGHLSVIRVLLSRVELNPVRCPGAIYWAARKSHWSILSALLEVTRVCPMESIGAALCGAATTGQESFVKVLEMADLKLGLRETIRGSFVDLVESLYRSKDAMDSLSHRQTSAKQMQTSLGGQPIHGDIEYEFWDALLPREDVLLQHACARGDMKAVQVELSDATKHATQGRRHLAACFTEAIRNEQLLILLYMCSKFPQSRYFSVDAALEVRSPATFQVLLDEGWDLNAVFARLKPPPLAWVVKSEQLTRWFLDHGADPNARCDWDITPFSVAIRDASLCTISLMLRRGADIRKGQLLHFAVEREAFGQLAIIDWLISAGVSLNSRMFENDPPSWLENRAFGMGTPLHRAADLDKVEVAKLLLDSGADHGIRDSIGRTAHDIAVSKGHDSVKQVIDAACSLH